MSRQEVRTTRHQNLASMQGQLEVEKNKASEEEVKTAALLCENSIRFLVQGCQISATLIICWIFNQHSKTANYRFLFFPPLWPALPPAGAGTNALNSTCNQCFPKQNLTFIKLVPRQHSPKTMTPSSK